MASLSVSGSLPSSFWVVIALVLLGFYGPPVVLTHQIQKRQEAIRNGFPDALDMLLVSVEAGLGLAAAIQRIAAELGPAHPIIAEEFAIVGLETRAGKARSEVLRDMADALDGRWQPGHESDPLRRDPRPGRHRGVR